jgi:LytS/YehU family sensor histidine kinase
VQCQNSNGLWSDASRLSFSIAPHFTDRLSFKITLIFSVLLIILLIVQNRIRASKAKLKTNILLKESELATLRNQMNPHFVFNSLNTLQDFIFDGNVVEANKYVGNFANLMRKSLEFSKRDKISLKEEILFIENYLKLEKIRFEDKFDYSIQTNVDLNKDNVFIIPLLIQPLVENAVKHAFKKLENKVGLINVSYNKINEDFIIIEVQDNGSGYDPNQEQKRSVNHQSMGIQIIKQRLELLNQKLQKRNYTLSYKKLDEGTKVTLKLPIYKS